MKKLVITALLAGQILSAQPAFAADLAEARTRQMGAFAGFRMRVPLGGDPDRRQLRAGLTLAPTLQSQGSSGEIRTRFGEGLEFGISGDQPARLSLAGTPVSRLAQGPNQDSEQRMGISTIGWVAIGVVAVVGILFVAGQLCADGEICGSE